MFKKGDRVELNEAWSKHCNGDPTPATGTKAEVVGYSRDRQDIVKIVFDGRVKTPTTFHQSFLTEVK
jgi:hypothetical protein